MDLAPSAGAAEYTDCISTDSLNECPRYDTKQPDCEAPVMLYFHYHRSQVHSGPS